MPNDAKLGLVVGVALVITVAVVFFRKEPALGDPAAATIHKQQATTTPPPSRLPGRSPVVQSTSGGRAEEDPSEGRRHTVRAGETLFSLAQQYYGDGDKFSLIFQVNRNRLESPDDLPPGTILVIPDLPR
jgi:nucleoid-associated protein YgaU